jgi:hypothetical protein
MAGADGRAKPLTSRLGSKREKEEKTRIPQSPAREHPQ